MSDQSAFLHPFDSPLSSALRFLTEVIAWVACPWAVTGASGWLAALTLEVLVGLPAVFSTRGDKRRIIVATPGPLRVLIEIALHAAAVSAPGRPGLPG